MLRSKPSIVPIDQLGLAVSHGVTLAIHERAAAIGLPGNALDPYSASLAIGSELPGTTTGIYASDP